MTPGGPTGFPGADAQDDFLRARRRQAFARLGRRVRGGGDVDLVLPFDEVVAALGRTGERRLGPRVVELDTVLGSVDRAGDASFDRAFRPTSSRVRARWERIAEAMRRGDPLPPVDLLRIGDVHFVRDGHHRVSVARALGHDVIEAQVTEVLTRVGADRELRLADLPVKAHERLFAERVPLDAERLARLRPSDPEDLGVLAEGIEAWGFRAMQDRAELLDRRGTAEAWWAEEFVPVAAMLRDAGLVQDGAREVDVYLQVACERYHLLHTHDWSEEVLAKVGLRRRRRRA